jgi:hypothetical protein
VALGLFAAGQLACGTSYRPRSDGQVRLVIHHGAALYVQDGRELPVGPFSGNLPGLVATCPAANEHARIAHRDLAVGASAYLAGAAGLVLGLLVLSGPAGWVVIGASATVGGTGIGFLGAGLTHAVDAVNLFNDASAARPSTCGQGAGAAGGPARSSSREASAFASRGSARR